MDSRKSQSNNHEDQLEMESGAEYEYRLRSRPSSSLPSSTSSSFSSDCCEEVDFEAMCGDEDVSDCAKFHMENFRRLLELDSLNKLETQTVRRLGSLSCKPWNPNDLTGTGLVRFRTDRPIDIVSFGFCGPFTGKGKYHVEIELLTEYYELIAASTQVTPIIKESEVFHVKFEFPIPILPCTWYNAKFSIMGPPTGQSRQIFQCAKVVSELDTCRFKFEEPDSHQLPEIAYKMRY